MGPIAEWVQTHGHISWGVGGQEQVILVQRALTRAGASLEIDGEWGGITEAATKRFQAAHFIPPVGFVGKATAPKLDAQEGEEPPSPGSTLRDAPWLGYMRGITGTKELPGERDSPIIMEWRDDIARRMPAHAEYSKNYTHDATPWCGLTAAWCMIMAGIEPPFGSNDTDKWLYALSWSKWKGATKLPKPITGCVMVFKREGGGHVTFLEKMDGTDACYCRGGNQSDMVNVSHRSMDGFVGAFWPPGRPTASVVADISNATGSGSEA
jgi:uncharacterized protein (TIGR02594 family)